MTSGLPNVTNVKIFADFSISLVRPCVQYDTSVLPHKKSWRQFWVPNRPEIGAPRNLQIFTSHLHTQRNSLMTRIRTLIGSGNILHVLLHSSAIFKHVILWQLNLLLILEMICVFGHSTNCEFIHPNVLLQIKQMLRISAPVSCFFEIILLRYSMSSVRRLQLLANYASKVAGLECAYITLTE